MTSPTNPKPIGSKSKKPIYYLFSFLIVLILLFIAAFPTLASTPAGKNLVCKYLSAKLRGTVEIEHLNLGWFSDQKVEGFEYESSQNNERLSFEKLDIAGTLWNLLIAKNKESSLFLQSPHAELHLTEDISSQTTSSSKAAPLAIGQNLTITDGQVVITDAKNQAIQFQNIELTAKMLSSHLAIQGKGSSSFNNTSGTFSYKVDANSLGSYKKNKTFIDELVGSSIQFDITANNFPMVGLDHLLSTMYPKERGVLVNTFGDVLTTTAKGTISKTDLSCDIEAISNYLKASLHTQTLASGVVIKNGSFVSLNIQPSAYKTFMHTMNIAKDTSLTKPAFIKASLQQLFIPKVNQQLDYTKTSADILLEASQLNLMLENINQTVAFNSLMGSIQTKDFSDAVNFSLQSSLNYGTKNPSSINTNFTLKHLTAASPFLYADALSNASIDIVRFPTPLLDALLDTKEMISKYLGSFANIKMVSNIDADKVKYTLSILTPQFSLPSLSLTVTKSIYVEKLTPFTYTLTEETKQLLANAPGLHIQSLSTLYGSIETFGLSLENLAQKNFYNLITQISLTTNNFKVNSYDAFGSFNIQKPHFRLNIGSLEKVLLGALIHAEYPPEEPYRHLLYGRYVDIQSDALINLSNFQNMTIPSIQNSIKSDRVSFDFELALLDHLTKLVVVHPIEGLVSPSPEFLNAYLKPKSSTMIYDPYTPLSFTVAIDPIYLNQPIFPQLAFKGHFALKTFDIVDNIWVKKFSVNGTTGTILGNVKQQTFQADLKSSATASNISVGSLTGSISSKSFNSPDFYKNQMDYSFNFNQFSSSMIDSILGFNNQLDKIIGSQFDFRLNVNHDLPKDLASLDFHSTNMDLQGDFIITDSITMGKRPLKFDWFVPEESYVSIQNLVGVDPKNRPITLESPGKVHLVFSEFSTPYLKGQANSSQEIIESMRKGSFDVDLMIEKFTLASIKLDNKVSVDAFKATLTKPNPSAPFTLTAHADVQEHSFSDKKGSLNANIQFTPAYETNQSIPLADIKINFTNFPTMILDACANLSKDKLIPPSIYLGQTINGTLETTLKDSTGPIALNLNSTASQAKLSGHLEDNLLTLSEPLSIEMTMTPSLSAYIEKETGIRIISTKKPIKLTASNQGFLVKTNPYSFSSIFLKEATFDLGELICANTGNTQDISAIFKQNTQPSSISIWFQPMIFSIRSGSLNLSRTEILYNRSLDVALWGKVDLVKRYVKMVLGLTEQSLNTAFGVKGLPKSFVLKIPVEGPYENVRLNKEVAAARIALLIAKITGITKQGGVFGNVVDMLGDFANDQRSVPAPRTPFPWDQELSENHKLSSPKDSVHIITNKKAEVH